MMPRHRPQPGTLVPFPIRDRAPGSIRRRTPGQVVDLEAYRGALAADEGDEEWNRLVPLAEAAWSWREPESIDALEACVERLKAAVRREWDTD